MLENTFLSLRKVAKALYPQISWLVDFAISDVWRNDEAVKKINDIDVLFFSGETDEMIPPSQMFELY